MNKKKAIKYSKDFIIADGHIDLPFRLNKEGLLFNKNINLNNETSGNFDIPKAKKGGETLAFRDPQSRDKSPDPTRRRGERGLLATNKRDGARA